MKSRHCCQHPHWKDCVFIDCLIKTVKTFTEMAVQVQESNVIVADNVCD